MQAHPSVRKFLDLEADVDDDEEEEDEEDDQDLQGTDHEETFNASPSTHS